MSDKFDPEDYHARSARAREYLERRLYEAELRNQRAWIYFAGAAGCGVGIGMSIAILIVLIYGIL